MSDAIYSPDVVIVGGGVAGLTVALNLAPRRVCVITKSSLGINTSSSWAQGGIAAAVSKDDSNESHINDTLTTAKGLANIDAIKEVINNAKGIIDDLEGYGVNFDKNEDGTFNLGLEGAHSFNRIIRSRGDSSGLGKKDFKHDVNVIFYDGDNSEQKMREFFVNMLDFTEDVFTLVVDDANIEENVAITKRFIDAIGLKILYERELLNDQEDPEMWWNGLYVVVLSKSGL